MRITLVRHGETEHNRAGRWQGHDQGRLSDTGRSQAASLGARLAGRRFDRVIVSDLERALETVDLAGVEARPDPLWREIDVGSWAGQTFADVRRTDPAGVDAMRSGKPVPLGGGETIPAFVDRLRAAFDRLAADLDEDESALVVTHGGVIWALASQHWDLPFPNRATSSVVNTSLTTWTHFRNAWRLTTFNDASHLGRRASLGDDERVVTLVRHGQTDANVREVWQGQTDWGLNDQGRSQAQALAAWLGHPGRLVASPLGRAVETATALNGGPPPVEPGLMEMSMGRWETLDAETIKSGWPELFAQIYEREADLRRGVTGETVSDLIARMEATMHALTDGDDLTVVSHGSAIRAYVVSVLGGGADRFRRTGILPNTGLAEVVVGPGPTRLHSYGLSAHLEGG